MINISSVMYILSFPLLEFLTHFKKQKHKVYNLIRF